MKRVFMYLLLLSFFCFFMLVGCQPGGQLLPYGLIKAPLQHTNRIVILDKNVRDALFLVNAVQERLPGGQIRVKAAFQNRFYQDDVWADVKVEFQDENDMAIDAGEWIPTLFPANQSTVIQSTSITPTAHKHVVLLKNLRTATGDPIGGPSDRVFAIP